ncbi:membrane protein [Microbacterium phage Morrigan]|nr:membrane protein [Microbacterium phage Morrigan]
MDIAFTLDPALIIGLLVSTVLPLLVGLVTTRVTHGGVKAVLLAGLALVTSLLTELGAAVSNGVAYDLGQGLLLAIPTFLIAVGMHYGLWKPVGAANAAQSVLVTPKAGHTG